MNVAEAIAATSIESVTTIGREFEVVLAVGSVRLRAISDRNITKWTAVRDNFVPGRYREAELINPIRPLVTDLGLSVEDAERVDNHLYALVEAIDDHAADVMRGAVEDAFRTAEQRATVASAAAAAPSERWLAAGF